MEELRKAVESLASRFPTFFNGLLDRKKRGF